MARDQGSEARRPLVVQRDLANDAVPAASDPDGLRAGDCAGP